MKNVFALALIVAILCTLTVAQDKPAAQKPTPTPQATKVEGAKKAPCCDTEKVAEGCCTGEKMKMKEKAEGCGEKCGDCMGKAKADAKTDAKVKGTPAPSNTKANAPQPAPKAK